MDRFVHEQNLTRYIDRLQSVTDPVTLRQIQKLLIEEVDRFGSLAERIDQADDLIRHAHGRLRQQQAFVARLQDGGADTASAVTLLATMTGTLQLMIEYRRTLSDGLARGAI